MKKILFGLATLLAIGNIAFAGVTLYEKDGTKLDMSTDIRFGVQGEVFSEESKDKEGKKSGERETSKYNGIIDRAKLYINFTKGPVATSVVTDQGAMHRDSYLKLNLTDKIYTQVNYNHNQLFIGDQMEWRWGNSVNGAVGMFSVEKKNGLKVGMKSENTEIIGGLMLDAPANETKKDKDGKELSGTGEGRIGAKGTAIVTINKNLKVIGEGVILNESLRTAANATTTAGIKYADNSKTGIGLGARAEIKTSDTMTIKPELLCILESQGEYKSKKKDDTSAKDKYSKDVNTFGGALKVEQPKLDIGTIATIQTINEKKSSDGSDKVKSSDFVVTPFVEFKKVVGDAGVYIEAAIGSKSVETIGTSKVESIRVTPKVLIKYKF